MKTGGDIREKRAIKRLNKYLKNPKSHIYGIKRAIKELGYDKGFKSKIRAMRALSDKKRKTRGEK